jgi:hypothetical protein
MEFFARGESAAVPRRKRVTDGGDGLEIRAELPRGVDAEDDEVMPAGIGRDGEAQPATGSADGVVGDGLAGDVAAWWDEAGDFASEG